MLSTFYGWQAQSPWRWAGWPKVTQPVGSGELHAHPTTVSTSLCPSVSDMWLFLPSRLKAHSSGNEIFHEWNYCFVVAMMWPGKDALESVLMWHRLRTDQKGHCYVNKRALTCHPFTLSSMNHPTVLPLALPLTEKSLISNVTKHSCSSSTFHSSLWVKWQQAPNSHMREKR